MAYDLIWNITEITGIIGIVALNVTVYINIQNRLDRVGERIDGIDNKIINLYREIMNRLKRKRNN